MTFQPTTSRPYDTAMEYKFQVILISDLSYIRLSCRYTHYGWELTVLISTTDMLGNFSDD